MSEEEIMNERANASYDSLSMHEQFITEDAALAMFRAGWKSRKIYIEELEKITNNECRHGVSLEFNCNACSDNIKNLLDAERFIR